MTTCQLSLDTVRQLSLNPAVDGSVEVPFTAGPGLCQFTLILDADRMDWEELYVNLELFENHGARTGPWDFDIVHQNRPLVPSYWVTLDGEPLGLWYMQRVSLEDLAARRFRGRMAFHLATGGEHRLAFKPYRSLDVTWHAATLEVDPEDTLDSRQFELSDWGERCPAARWADPKYWADLKARLETTHVIYREPLERMYRWLAYKITPKAKEGAAPGTWGFASPVPTHQPDDILPLLAEYRLTGREGALTEALAAIDAVIALPHWGNPQEGAYGCDGDMGASHFLRALSWAWHAMRDLLGDERRELLRAKLQLQGTRFFRQCLLHRDYWGGSVIQDHGKVSLAEFGTAALHLLGVLPDAATWTAYVIPRVQRSLDAMPRDGHIPPSSYSSPILYLDTPGYYREALLALTGEDTFDQPQFRAVVDYLFAGAAGYGREELVARFGKGQLMGAAHVLNRLATKFGDGRAAWLQRRRLDQPPFGFGHNIQEVGYYHAVLMGLLTHDPRIEPTPPGKADFAPLRFYPDSGAACYRDRGQDLDLNLACGPWCGYTAYRQAKGPCDRMEVLSGSGHFSVNVRGESALATPDGGYRLRYHTRNLLLVDDQGPSGDVGYPMSIPSFTDRGEEIEVARWDDEEGAGFVRLQLAPAYDAALGMLRYTRDFVLRPGQPLVIRDQVVFDRPHHLAWHFHGRRDIGVKLVEPLTAAFGSLLQLAAASAESPLQASLAPTEVVYSYSSQRHTFDHVRFATAGAVTQALVEFTCSVMPD